MPGVHRDGDSRICGAATKGTGSTVLINGKVCAVEGDLCDHGQGALEALYGSKNVYVGGKLIICATGDIAKADSLEHLPGETNPLGHSTNVIVYGGAAGGGS